MHTDAKLRFEFGDNWSRFLSLIDEDRIRQAEAKLSEALGEIKGKSFLDVGSGSGIHSLAAIRLGASRVHSFDFDPKSVSCAKELRRRFAPDADWNIEQGSALDAGYLSSLGKFDIVYSWGVLHHTGDMWTALNQVTIPVHDKLMIAIYNDQGRKSRVWRSVKRVYVSAGILKFPISVLVLLLQWGPGFIVHPAKSVSLWRNYKSSRGMSAWHDVVDWAGGYPFEVAAPDKIFSLLHSLGFNLENMKTVNGHGCNEFVLTKTKSHV